MSGKRGPAPSWKAPQDIPTMERMFGKETARYEGAGGSCIHCHMITRSEVVSERFADRPVYDRVFWPYPLPREIGIEMDPDEVATVLRLREGTPAARASLQVGDRLARIDGQPILSTADIQWVLHRAGSPSVLGVDIERADETLRVPLRLAEGWRTTLGDWRYLNELRIADLLNFRVAALGAEARADLGLDEDALALRVFWANVWPTFKTDLREGDVIVAVDGRRAPLTVANFTRYLYQDTSPGDTLELTYLRDGKEIELVVTMP